MENSIDAVAPSTADTAVADRPTVSDEPEQSELADPGKLRHNHGPNFGRQLIDGCPRCEYVRANPQIRNGTLVHNHKVTSTKFFPGCKLCRNIRMEKRAEERAIRIAMHQENAKRALEHVRNTVTPPPPDPEPAPRATSFNLTNDGMVHLTYEQLQELMASRNGGGDAQSLKDFARELATELRKPDPEEQAKRDAEKARAEQRRAMRNIEIQAEEDGKRQRKEMCASVGHRKENGKSAINLGQVFSDGFHHPMCHRCGLELPLVKPAPGAS